MTDFFRVQVDAIRVQKNTGIGGCIFSGRILSATSIEQRPSSYVVVRVAGRDLGSTRVHAGQVWCIAGLLGTFKRTINSRRIVESQINASMARLQRPAGSELIELIAGSQFQGVGSIKAKRLWDAFGADLVTHLDQANVTELSSVLSSKSAIQAISAWHTHTKDVIRQNLHCSGVEEDICGEFLDYFGMDAAPYLKADPYRLLSFGASWRAVDSLAREQFALAPNDKRRVQAAVEECLYRLFFKGRNLSSTSQISRDARNLLESDVDEVDIAAMLATGETNGSYIVDSDQTLQLIGARVVTECIASAVACRLPQHKAATSVSKSVEKAILSFQTLNGITLSPEQRMAVQMAAVNRISLITGEAGTGKTTVLRVLHQIFDNNRTKVHLAAPSGSAANALTESTGRAVVTVAALLRCIQLDQIAEHSVVMIDDASTLDVVSLYALCSHLPRSVRILLAGDINIARQTAPSAAMQGLLGVGAIPRTQLTDRRHASAIAAAATAALEGDASGIIDSLQPEVIFIQADESELSDVVSRLYAEFPFASVVLSTRQSGIGSGNQLNVACQRASNPQGAELFLFNEEFEAIESTGLRVGDPLTNVQPLYGGDVRRHSMGTLLSICDHTATSSTTELKPSLGNILWDDGITRPFTMMELRNLHLGYAIPVKNGVEHKLARVILALTNNPSVNNTTIYAALTRAQCQVVIVGGAQTLHDAIQRTTKVTEHCIALERALTLHRASNQQR